MTTPTGQFLKVSTSWSRADYLGQIRCRISGFRMNYAIKPGLYAVGDADETSHIFVSANYKLSFDILRRALKGLKAWILVLDTNGINVWCAAGKGTFGTAELVNRIREVKLDMIVSRKIVVVPQLGAPGVNSNIVQRETGFKVCFGPVRAKDIPDYLEADFKATEEMRTVRFTLLDRLVLTPMEIIPIMRRFPLYTLVILLVMGLQPSGILFKDIWYGGMPLLILGLASVLTGGFFAPILLPFVPFRSFAAKGWITGIIPVIYLVHVSGIFVQKSLILIIFSYLFFPLASSYIALQFTGSTPFTGMSGVKKELKIAIPVYLTGLAISVILLAGFKLREWGLI